MDKGIETTRDRILSSAYSLFYKQGFSRVSIDTIAENAGITKRALYYHFDSKDSLVAAALAAKNSRVLADMQNWGLDQAQSAEQLSDLLFNRLEKWAAQPRWAGSGFTRLTTELADLPGHPARKAASDHKAEVERWLASQLRDLGNRSPEIMAAQILILVEGCMSLTLIHGTVDYIRRAADASRILIRAG